MFFAAKIYQLVGSGAKTLQSDHEPTLASGLTPWIMGVGKEEAGGAPYGFLYMVLIK